jgi:type III secretory pathway component EscV
LAENFAKKELVTFIGVFFIFQQLDRRDQALLESIRRVVAAVKTAAQRHAAILTGSLDARRFLQGQILLATVTAFHIFKILSWFVSGPHLDFSFHLNPGIRTLQYLSFNLAN